MIINIVNMEIEMLMSQIWFIEMLKNPAMSKIYRKILTMP